MFVRGNGMLDARACGECECELLQVFDFPLP